jgi:signal transduction histidine kinase
MADPRPPERSLEWAEFVRVSRTASAHRNRGFLLVGAALIIAFSAFDLLIDPISGTVLRERLFNNAIILALVLSAAAALSVPAVQQKVFATLFVLVVCVLVGQAYLLGVVSPSPSRLAFHFLAILVLTMLAIQWFWQWQLAVSAVVILLYGLVVPFDHRDFAFFSLGLCGSTVLATTLAYVFVRWRFQQFAIERRLSEANQAALEQADRLAAKNAELTDLVYVLSHDLRAPLINLEGFAQSLEVAVGQLDHLLLPETAEDGKRLADAKQEVGESLHFIRQAVDRMNVLVGGILQLSRLDSKPPRLALVDLGELVQSVLATFQYQLSQRHIRVNVGALPTVVGDPVRLGQVVSNLIDNAIKYMKPDGPAQIDVSGEQLPEMDVVSVRDSGVGIRPEDQAKVFRLFARLGNNGTPGDGIGLATVKKIVEQSGGTITVESEPGQGSVFRFTVPRWVQ